ncbi:hypothetical protein DITRI_Ditri04bG0018200 [Diplodiscus trichospermus]
MDLEVCRTLKDAIIWKKSVNGRYSTKQFRYCYGYTCGDNFNVWKMLWSGLAPPKVETCCWQLLKKRLAEELITYSFIVISLGEFGCSGCHNGVFSGARLRMQFHSSCHVVFNGASPDLVKLIDLIKLRLAFWIMAKWPKIAAGTLDVFRSLLFVSVPEETIVEHRNSSWSPPPSGSLKFNVDGSALGQPGLTGISGILKDSEANVKLICSKAIGVEDSNMAEF